MILKKLTKIVSLTVALGISASAERPNVLFISIDDFRPELGAYGSNQVLTPHIDRLAAQGLRFDRAYCQVPVCGASRASLLTSILPTQKRFINYLSQADKDVPGAVTLPEAFKLVGYTTLSNGKIFHEQTDADARSWSKPAWRPDGIDHMKSYDPETTTHLSKRGQGRIFESPDVPDDAYFDGLVAEKTIKDLGRLKASDKPFFLACGFIRPHMPFYAPKKYWDLYDRDAIEIADNRFRPKNAPRDLRGSGEYSSYHLADFSVKSEAFHRMMRHGYLASTSYVDQLTGDVLAALEAQGLADNTIVVIWGDHGFHLGEHDFWGKHNTTHVALQVPLIIKIPGQSAAVSQSVVQSIDLYPTLCDLAGVEIPSSVQGRSLRPLFDNPQQVINEASYSRWRSGDGVVTPRYNFTSFNGGKAEMLYDLKNDPDENVNVVGDPAYQAALGKMRGLLKEKMDQASSAKFGSK